MPGEDKCKAFLSGPIYWIRHYIKTYLFILIYPKYFFSTIVQYAMSPKRVWRNVCAQIELRVEIANLGVE